MTKDKKPPPTPEELRELLEYDPETGVLTWKARPDDRTGWNSRYAGRQAFSCLHPNGYLVGTVLARSLLAHRVAWVMHHGQWPLEQIDHINGVRSDNRIENLRAVSHAVNGRNAGPHRKKSTLPTGVGLSEGLIANPYRAQIQKQGKHIYIGNFPTPEAAHEAYLEKAAELGFSLRHGRKTDG